jgi:hypothetical protein
MTIPSINRPATVTKAIFTGFKTLTTTTPHPNTIEALQRYILGNIEKTGAGYYLDATAVAHDLRHLWAGKALQGFAYGTEIPAEHIVRQVEDVEMLLLAGIKPTSELGMNILIMGQLGVTASIYNIAKNLFEQEPRFHEHRQALISDETLFKMTDFIHQQLQQLVVENPNVMLANQEKFKDSDEWRAFMVICTAPKKDLNQVLGAIGCLRILMLNYSRLHTLDFTKLEAQRPSPIVRNKQWLSAIGHWDVTQDSLRYSGLTPQAKANVVAGFKQQNTTDVKEAQTLWKANRLQQQAEVSGQQLRTPLNTHN